MELKMSYLQSLTVFLTAADEGSFLKAAKKLGLSQPTVSFHIDNLEKNFGCPLFNRTTQGVSLTVYGRQLYENTSAINVLVHQTKNQIKAMLKGSFGHIAIGASTIPSDYILPPIIAGFLKMHPQITFSVTTGNSKTILSSFQKKELPLVLVGVAPPKELGALPLWPDELVLAAHPHLAAELAHGAATRELKSIPLILRRESSGARNAILSALEEQNITVDQLKIVLEVDSNQALKSAILHRVGIGFISRWAVRTELLSSELIILPLAAKDAFSLNLAADKPAIPNIKRNFYALIDNSPQPACTQAFFEYLIDNSNQAASDSG